MNVSFCSDLYHTGLNQPVYGIAINGTPKFVCIDCAAQYAVARVFAGDNGKDVAGDINYRVCDHMNGNCDLCLSALVGELQSAAAVSYLSGYKEESNSIRDAITYWAEEKKETTCSK